MIHIHEGVKYEEVDGIANVGDLVYSEECGFPRIYECYHTTDTKLILAKYSRGHVNLSYYKVLKEV